jgi:glutathione S-transferase
VQSLDDLGPRVAETQQEAAVADGVHRERRHGDRRRRARTHLHDARAELHTFHVRRQVGERGDGVHAPRLGAPGLVDAELLGFGGEGQHGLELRPAPGRRASDPDGGLHLGSSVAGCGAPSDMVKLAVGMSIHILYGSHASYATAKTRSYLRKKGIPFVERLPAHPRFREHVRPGTGSHRIPQLELPDGSVVQDTVEIFDTLEAVFPDPPAYPPGPRQQLAARLFEVLLDGLLGRPAWHYRWNFMRENYRFVGREFGRSFVPQGSDEDLDHYGRIIADRMEGKREGIGASEAVLPVFEAIYADTLDLLEAHFTDTPYLFGGRPSVADFALMGPLFGHLARDPHPSTLMKLRAPRVFRWTEAMNTPEIQSPEFADVASEFAPDDRVPEKTLELLRLCVADAGGDLPRSAEIYNDWVADRAQLPAGSVVSEKADEPVVGRFESSLRGVPLQAGAGLYPLWVLQRGLNWFASQDASSRAAGREMLASCGGEAILDIRMVRPLARVNGRIALG